MCTHIAINRKWLNTKPSYLKWSVRHRTQFLHSAQFGKLCMHRAVKLLALICNFLNSQCCNTEAAGMMQNLSETLTKALDIMLLIHKARIYAWQKNGFSVVLNDKYKLLFLMKINNAYNISDWTKPYIKLAVILILLKLLTLLSTVNVDNTKYLIKSVRLAQYDRNWWKKSW